MGRFALRCCGGERAAVACSVLLRAAGESGLFCVVACVLASGLLCISVAAAGQAAGGGAGDRAACSAFLRAGGAAGGLLYTFAALLLYAFTLENLICLPLGNSFLIIQIKL